MIECAKRTVDENLILQTTWLIVTTSGAISGDDVHIINSIYDQI